MAPYNLFKAKPQRISKRASLKKKSGFGARPSNENHRRERESMTDSEMTVFRRKMVHNKTERRETQNLTDPTEQAGSLMQPTRISINSNLDLARNNSKLFIVKRSRASTKTTIGC